MRLIVRYYSIVFGLLVCWYNGHGQFYQGSQNEFGKNRVQYREFLWQQYRFKEYDVYFYEGGQQLAEFTTKVVPQNIAQLEDVFDYAISDKIQFIVYNTQSDFKQSNIGVTGEEQFNIGGATRIIGSKVFVYFEGDYIEFDKQIKDGIARVLINNILYGGNWRDKIKSSTLLNLPEWYIEGLLLYASKNVDPDTESIIRDAVLTGKYEKFNRLEGRESYIAGYALWRYVAEVYGENIIPNILYMSRVSRNVESGFLFVLGKSLESITNEFVAYYKGENAVGALSKTDILINELPIKSKKRRVYTQYEVSPDGKSVAYVSNVMGQYRIYVYDIEKQKRKKILKAEHKLERIVDYSFPVLCWHPSGQALSYITEKRGMLMLNTYEMDQKKTSSRELFQLDKVLAMEYSPNGQQLVMSGVSKGQTDIYLYYTIGNRQEKLTNDYYGDFDPSFSLDGNKILFSSNRPDDTLRSNQFPYTIRENRDVFAFNLKSKSPYLERITDTPDFTEYDPYQYDSIRYTFRADFDGILNRYVATYDSTISRIDTTIHYRYYTVAKALSNYTEDLLNYSVHPKTGRFGFMAFSDNKYHFYVGSFKNDALEGSSSVQEALDTLGMSLPSFESKEKSDGIETVRAIKLEKPRSVDNAEIDINNYRFEGEKDFEYEKQTITITEVVDANDNYTPAKEGTIRLDSLSLPGARNYNLNFTTDYLVSQIDNTFMTQFYQNLTGSNNLNPGLSGLVKFGTSDLFEDYRIIGGFQLSGNLNANTVMLSGEDLSRRVDRRLQIYRQQTRASISAYGINPLADIVTYSAAYRLSYPINEVFSLRGSAMFRNDQSVILATDRRAVGLKNLSSNYAGLKIEAVFDNALNMGLNLRRGMRWKIWGEYYKDPTNFDRDFIVYGLDFRQYQKIHRKLIWANRLAFSSSLGRERLTFFLGGVDNWMFPREDNGVPLDPDQNYQFQTRASPMRGFIGNVRNGNSFAVINSELRWPIFSYFFNKPLKSDFLENFQIVGFGDIGSAWTGLQPYSDENTFNNRELVAGNLNIEVKNNRDPVVYGYGVGLRVRILGYFVRADWAWGIDDGIVLDRVFYLSLSLDF